MDKITDLKYSLPLTVVFDKTTIRENNLNLTVSCRYISASESKIIKDKVIKILTKEKAYK